MSLFSKLHDRDKWYMASKGLSVRAIPPTNAEEARRPLRFEPLNDAEWSEYYLHLVEANGLGSEIEKAKPFHERYLLSAEYRAQSHEEANKSTFKQRFSQFKIALYTSPFQAQLRERYESGRKLTASELFEYYQYLIEIKDQNAEKVHLEYEDALVIEEKKKEEKRLQNKLRREAKAKQKIKTDAETKELKEMLKKNWDMEFAHYRDELHGKAYSKLEKEFTTNWERFKASTILDPELLNNEYDASLNDLYRRIDSYDQTIRDKWERLGEKAKRNILNEYMELKNKRNSKHRGQEDLVPDAELQDEYEKRYIEQTNYLRAKYGFTCSNIERMYRESQYAKAESPDLGASSIPHEGISRPEIRDETSEQTRDSKDGAVGMALLMSALPAPKGPIPTPPACIPYRKEGKPNLPVNPSVHIHDIARRGEEIYKRLTFNWGTPGGSKGATSLQMEDMAFEYLRKYLHDKDELVYIELVRADRDYIDFRFAVERWIEDNFENAMPTYRPIANLEFPITIAIPSFFRDNSNCVKHLVEERFEIFISSRADRLTNSKFQFLKMADARMFEYRYIHQGLSRIVLSLRPIVAISMLSSYSSVFFNKDISEEQKQEIQKNADRYRDTDSLHQFLKSLT
jgi:hypothetical protein